jgi:IclR family acetate operon transcriptional repressor
MAARYDSDMRTKSVAVRSRAALPRATTNGPMAIRRMVSVLEAISSALAPQSLTELSRLLGIPKSSLLALLVEMEQLGLIARDDSARYALGGRAHRLGLQLVAPGSVAALVRQSVTALSATLGMTATFSRLDAASRALIYSDRCDVPDPVHFAVSLGQPVDLHCRAAGKLLLAHLPRTERRRWLGPEPWRAMTTLTHIRWKTLEPELASIATMGVAWSHGESFPGVGSCNVGVTGADGRVLAALGVEMALQRLANAQQTQVAQEAHIVATLRSAADALSQAMRTRDVTARSLPAYL